MAKMFYTLAETANRLGMDQNDVRDLMRSGQLEEFRDDSDNLIFKVAQVDLLAGDDGGIGLAPADGSSIIPLASDDLEPLSLAGSDTGMGLTPDAKDQTGISIFDPDETERADPSAQTQVTADLTAPDYNMDAAASGSGLYDLTQSGEDAMVTSADLLADVYTGGGESDTNAASSGGSALFESVGSESASVLAAAAAAPAMLVAGEPYDGAGSGLSAGAALAACLTCLIAFVVALFSLAGGNAAQLIDSMGIAENAPYIVAGVGFGSLVVFGLVGWLLLRKS